MTSKLNVPRSLVNESKAKDEETRVVPDRRELPDRPRRSALRCAPFMQRMAWIVVGHPRMTPRIVVQQTRLEVDKFKEALESNPSIQWPRNLPNDVT